MILNKLARLSAIMTVLILISCPLMAANTVPTLSAVAPNADTTAPYIWRTYICTYSDADGYANLKICRLLVNTAVSSNGGGYFLYNRSTNKFFMYKNDGSLVGGITRGTAGIISSENASLDCRRTRVMLSGSTITIAWVVKFNVNMSGKKHNIYVRTEDAAGGVCGFACKGTVTINQLPTLSAITPSSGTTTPNVWRTYTCTYSDADGYANLRLCRLLINTSTSSNGAGYFLYNRSTNKFYMYRNDGSLIGGIARGTTGTISTENALLDCGGTRVTFSANTITIVWKVKFNLTMSGKVQNIYARAEDAVGGVCGFVSKGTVTINQTPTLGTITPTDDSTSPNIWRTYTCRYSDADGYSNLKYCRLLINTSVSSNGGGYFLYNCNTQKFYVYKNDGSATGGITYGAAGIISSENASLNCGITKVTQSSGTITIVWKVKFGTTMSAKTHNIYVRAEDAVGGVCGFAKRGTVTVLAESKPLSETRVAPISLVMFAGTTYTFSKAHAIDIDGSVVTNINTFDWTSDDTSVVTVQKTGLSADGRYNKATLTALKAGTAMIIVAAGGKHAYMSVNVIDNPTNLADRFMEVPLNQDGLTDIPVNEDGYRYMYFYADPGAEYRLDMNATTGHGYVQVSYDQTFGDSYSDVQSGYTDFASEAICRSV
ncbi:hypothetical protein LLG46_10070, partial [bacterium]|nr:hypothetical protein [bacterium]